MCGESLRLMVCRRLSWLLRCTRGWIQPVICRSARSTRSLILLALITALSINGCTPAVTANNTVELPMNLPVLGVTMVEQNPLGLYAFTNVNVLTMERAAETATILRHQTLIVANQHIVALGPATQLPVPFLATQIDGTGKYLLPGLADMHIHLREEGYLLLLLANGVTTVRNMDGAPQHLLWRDQIARGELIGPRIFTSGPIIDELPPHLPDDRAVESAAGAAQIVAEQKQLGYDFIKVYDGLTIGAYDNLIAAARHYDMPVVGHVPDRMPLQQVLTSGQRSVEHLDGYFGVYQDQLPDLLRTTVAYGVWNCPTLIVCQSLQSTDQPQSNLQRTASEAMNKFALEFWFLPKDFADQAYTYAPVHELQRSMIQQLHAVGAPLLLGTDAPIPYAIPGYGVHQELQNLVDAGLSPYEALRTATYNAAQFVDQIDQFGTIGVGKQADLVLLNANPLADIAHTQDIQGVMVQGNWLPESVLRQLLHKAERT